MALAILSLVVFVLALIGMCRLMAWIDQRELYRYRAMRQAHRQSADRIMPFRGAAYQPIGLSEPGQPPRGGTAVVTADDRTAWRDAQRRETERIVHDYWQH